MNRCLAPALRIAVLPALLLGFAAASCRDFSPRDAGQPILPLVTATPVPPMTPLASDAIFTATNEVRDLRWDGKTLWVATSGGVLRYQSGRWTRWNRADGLPSHEAQSLWYDAKGLHIRFPAQEALLHGQRVEVQNTEPAPRLEPRVSWRGATWKATLSALESPHHKVAIPAQSTGTHISALLAERTALVVALYGDGLWRWSGKSWARDPRGNNLPPAAREITALAGDANSLWLGTRRDGVFRFWRGTWVHISRDDEPISTNMQNLTLYHGVLWGSTLEDGLVFRGGTGWGQVAPPLLSSNAPRHLSVFGDKLYVRHGNGMVDAYDGRRWEKNALKDIPRRGVYALDADENTLFCAGWGGWSEWDGQTWTSHYDVPELKGVPLVGLAVAGDDVWLATQSHGVGRYHRSTGEFHWYDERAGLPDDWITALLVTGKTAWAGSFVGGLARFDGGAWTVIPELKGENITALVRDGQDGVFAATRHGLWRVSESGAAQKVALHWLDEEQQALLATSQGLWIGARTSLNFWRPPLPARVETVNTVGSHPDATASATTALTAGQLPPL